MLEKINKKSDSYISEMPFHAYQGNEPYIFVSYAHADAHLVFPEIKRLHDAGLNVWYDQGIAPGNEWTEEIGKALEGCSLFIVFISQNSANSVNVRNEINFALHDKKPFFSIYLEETDLPSGLKLSLGSLQSILKYAMSDDEYLFRCNKALKQNGFDISTGGLVKYNIEPTPTKPKNKPKKSNTKYIAIGVIAIVAIIAIIFASSSLTTNSSNSDLALKITHAYISHTGYSNITGEFNHVPDNMEGLSVKVEYFNSSGGLVETTMSDGVKPTDKSNEYTICEEKANNNTIDKIKVYILDNKGDTICYDEYKLDFNNLPLTS